MILKRKELEKYPVIGSGGQGKVYQIDKNTVVKVSEDINIELLKRMSSASLKQFIMPMEEVYDEEDCYTFTFPLLDKVKNESALILSKNQILQNIDILVEDIREISKQRIILADVVPINSFCIDKTIYMFDYDLYYFASECLSEEEIFKINLSKLNFYFRKLWIIGLIETGIDRLNLRFHPEYVCDNCISAFKEDMLETESIKEYIKRRINSGI